VVRFELEWGYKSPNDVRVRIYSYGEVFPVKALLILVKHFADSEDDIYPQEEGNLGRGMLASALLCAAMGIPIPTILKKFKLEGKGKNLVIVDKRIEKSSKVLKRIDNLAELM